MLVLGASKTPKTICQILPYAWVSRWVSSHRPSPDILGDAGHAGVQPCRAHSHSQVTSVCRRSYTLPALQTGPRLRGVLSGALDNCLPLVNMEPGESTVAWGWGGGRSTGAWFQGAPASAGQWDEDQAQMRGTGSCSAGGTNDKCPRAKASSTSSGLLLRPNSYIFTPF